MDLKLEAPSRGGGFVDKKDHEDHLCAFLGTEGTEVPDSFNGGFKKAIRLDVFVDLEHEDGLVVLEDAIIDGGYVVGGLKSPTVVARIRKGVPEGGSRAGWYLEDPTEEDIAAAEKVLSERVTVRGDSFHYVADEAPF